MNITFLIGNGFDLSLGIESSYLSFYKWYCSKNSENKDIQEFKQNINEDISRDIPDEDKTWADFELGLGKYTEFFDKETVDKYLDCFEDVQENIRKYLIEQQNKFDVEDYSDDSFLEFSESLWRFFDEVSDREKNYLNMLLNNYIAEHRRISFITFNYTKTLEKILDKIPDRPLHTWKSNYSTYAYNLDRDIIHVHGTTDVFPVLGVNDETQITKKELLETPQFKEFLIKTENVQALGQLWHNRAEERISNSKIVCMMGLSIGNTDAKWWRKICQWLKADTSRRVILYWFEKNPPNSVSSIKHIRCVNKAKEKLLSYSNLSDTDKDAIKDRIHVVINTSKFLKLKKKEIDAELESAG